MIILLNYVQNRFDLVGVKLVVRLPFSFYTYDILWYTLVKGDMLPYG